MLYIEGWEELFINYQTQFILIRETLMRRVNEEGVSIVPKPMDILNPFRYCSFRDVKVVVLGESPYRDRANGLAFAVNELPLTQSLRVLCDWLGRDTIDVTLKSWTNQGVLLLNSIPTMETGKKQLAHRVLWESFIRGCINMCSSKSNIAFLLLGSVPAEYEDSIIGNNLVIKEMHPVYFARMGIKCNKIDIFDVINEYLINNGKSQIEF